VFSCKDIQWMDLREPVSDHVLDVGGDHRLYLGRPLSGYKDSMQGSSGLGVWVFASKAFGLRQRLLGVIFFCVWAPLSWFLLREDYFRSQQEHTQGGAIGGQGGPSAKRPDWACLPNQFPLSVSQKEKFAIFARAFCTLAARLWQARASARVRQRREVNQGALLARD
jgi:hypothetical protein